MNVFTDGSCRKNGKPGASGGWACVFPEHPEFTASGILTTSKITNNVAEFMGILKSIETVLSIMKTNTCLAQKLRDDGLDIYSDSDFCIKCLTSWHVKWEKNGWVTTSGNPVKNRELIQDILALMKEVEDAGVTISYRHVRAHTGGDSYEERWNDEADRLATGEDRTGPAAAETPKADLHEMSKDDLIDIIRRNVDSRTLVKMIQDMSLDWAS